VVAALVELGVLRLPRDVARVHEVGVAAVLTETPMNRILARDLDQMCLPKLFPLIELAHCDDDALQFSVCRVEGSCILCRTFQPQLEVEFSLVMLGSSFCGGGTNVFCTWGAQDLVKLRYY
jgi:hypothetical protein